MRSLTQVIEACEYIPGPEIDTDEKLAGELSGLILS